MPDSQREITPPQSWSVESLKNDRQTVVRKFLNPAIYVEKPIMPPLRKTSPIFTGSSRDGENTSRTMMTDRSVKRCTCVTSPKNCPCHPLGEKTPSSSRCGESSSSSSDVGSQITVKSKRLPNDSEIKLSLTSLDTGRTDITENTIDIDPKEKEERVKSWLRKKDLEKKKKELEKARLEKAKEEERQQMLERERGNYKKWLARKKVEKEKIEREKERLEEEERKVKEEGNERKQKVNEVSYQSWLRKKKRTELEKKIKEKLALLQVFEEKQKRMEENERAFTSWLENSKNKPKPVPLNQGLKSLCSSLSITYINPVPWVANLEGSTKPASQ
ncbi:hypothetical protein JTB14_033164 [Gonioctena quinquepunctata]|nr:hypothetical protein JTB14_033164 [Gonioctena quinquepunctata]